MNTVAVIDYGMSNLRSVVNALTRAAAGKARLRVTSRPAEVLKADRVVFPGQGAARDCMRSLADHGLESVILEAAARKPFLGVCMGMQVLLTYSEENDRTPCLGLFAGHARRFESGQRDTADGPAIKIPHMGWNTIEQTRRHPLWQGIRQASYFYFVHSYYALSDDPDLAAGTTGYGHVFTSVMAHDNVFLMQCHPEKSAAAGLRLLGNFLSWDGSA